MGKRATKKVCMVNYAILSGIEVVELLRVGWSCFIKRDSRIGKEGL